MKIEEQLESRKVEYRLPLNKLKELAEIVKNKYKLLNIYVGGSQSPKSHHYPKKDSDIDFSSYMSGEDYIKYVNYVHATPEIERLYTECRIAHECSAKFVIDSFGIHLWVEPIYTELLALKDQVLLVGQPGQPPQVVSTKKGKLIELGKPVRKDIVEKSRILGDSRQKQTEREWKEKARAEKATRGQQTLGGISRKLEEYEVSTQEKSARQWRASLPKNMNELKSARPNEEFEVKRDTFAGRPRVTIYRTFGGEKVAGEGENIEEAIFQLYRASGEHPEDVTKKEKPVITQAEIIKKLERFRPITIEEADKLYTEFLEPEGWRIDQPMGFEWWRICQPKPEIFGISGTFETFTEAVGHIIRKSRPAWLAAKVNMEKPIITQPQGARMVDEKKLAELIAKKEAELLKRLDLLAEIQRLKTELERTSQ